MTSLTSSPTAYTVVDHLLDRVSALGVERIFGVPGDFTLAMLDRVEEHPDLEWVGCAGELGAAYAADGYARIRGLGVVCTTFGVGELSAINGIAGAYAEQVPVIHVVGAPATAVQQAGLATHHTLGDGDFRHFQRMSAEVTCVQASLTLENAAAEIDHVIREVLERRLPGYLVIPADVALAEVEPAAEPLHRHADATSPRALEHFRAAARPLVLAARWPAVLADILVERFAATDALRALVAGGVPHATLLWGRRVVDESAPGFAGIYAGAASAPGVREAIEEADLLIRAGVRFTDLTSGFFSQHLPAGTIRVDGTAASIDGIAYGPISMPSALAVLRELLEERDTAPIASAPAAPAPAAPAPATPEPTSAPLGQRALWDGVAGWLADGDLVVADQGTAFYGVGAHRLPHGVLFIGQPLWASIGYTLPAVLGAALAAPQRRPVLLIGDGAAQLTIGELGTLARAGVPAIVVLVDNAGYTVERAIHGPTAGYNDIAPWDWPALARALGATTAVEATTARELRDALDVARRGARGLRVIVARVPRDDVPPLLEEIAEAAAAATSRQPNA
jgi:alpha-keto-acid decarboxylase